MDLSLAVLTHRQPVTALAAGHAVSRTFCYQQAHKAQAALQQAFTPSPAETQVLFYLPVTKAWIHQFVLAQTLIGHSSDRGVQELLACLLDYHQLSLGTIHNLLRDAARQAAAINAAEDLSLIRTAAFDEIYQHQQPVLVGMDLTSSYCFLLAPEQNCDATTWGVHLLELSERRKLHLHYSLSDAGHGLRSGLAEAWPQVPCHADVFHVLQEMAELLGFLRQRTTKTSEAVAKLQQQLEVRPAGWSRTLDGRRGQIKRKLLAAQHDERYARQLQADVQLLSQWLQADVLTLAGDDQATRRELYDFVVAELRRRESIGPPRLRQLVKNLAQQRENLLGAAGVMDRHVQRIAQQAAVAEDLVRQVLKLQALDAQTVQYWQQRGQLLSRLGERLADLEQAVQTALRQTPRASSLVENLNGRLRCYFYLRRQIGPAYLQLLQFFLNHRRYVRSRHPDHVGRSPAELLGGREQPHWLELLGYRLFRRS